MANEIQAQTTAGRTLYAVIVNSVGKVYNGTAFVTIAGADWANYDYALTEAAAGLYFATMPTVTADLYSITIYERAGATPATTDTQVDTQTLDWNGAGSVVVGSGSYYGTLARLRAEHLTQVPTGATNDSLLVQALTTATALIDSALGFSFATYGAAAAKDVRCLGATATWDIPYHSIASVTTVLEIYSKGTSSESTDAITDFDELDDGRLYYATGWQKNQWYRITAAWGYGAAPEEIIKVAMQLAVDLWHGRDARGSADMQNVEGPGAAPVQRAFTWQQYQVLQQIRREYGNFGVA
ncbi:MAG: hypothetical protein QG637_1353 [Chloroflexota bacterium]|nr:hypothetical protein [Chloroflexota bacterium]